MGLTPSNKDNVCAQYLPWHQADQMQHFNQGPNPQIYDSQVLNG